jgi:FAD binding domain
MSFTSFKHLTRSLATNSASLPLHDQFATLTTSAVSNKNNETRPHILPQNSHSHPDNPIPEEPHNITKYELHGVVSSASSEASVTDAPSSYSSDSETPSTLTAETQLDEAIDTLKEQPPLSDDFPRPAQSPNRRRASTKLISENADDVRRLLGVVGQGGTSLVEKVCCGGGCCKLSPLKVDPKAPSYSPVKVPDNAAFRSLQLRLDRLSKNSELTSIVDLPAKSLCLLPLSANNEKPESTVAVHPPRFVTPHPPYDVYSARVHHARELTKPGAEKRTYHFDLDVTDYPVESGDVDFVVGGAVGICAPNETAVVDDVFDMLGVPRFIRDKPVLLETEGGRWPTIWGDEKPRELVTTRRELLTWCADIQSYPPTKQLLRLMAEYTSDEDEKLILMYLSSAQGQGAFCEYVPNFP